MSETFHVDLDGDDPDGSLGLCIAEALAVAKGTDSTGIGLCLHDYVDLNALVELFGPGSGRSELVRRGTVSFAVEEWVVVVDVGRDGEAEVTVAPARTDAARTAYALGTTDRRTT